jgi:hypothetical protein
MLTIIWTLNSKGDLTATWNDRTPRRLRGETFRRKLAPGLRSRADGILLPQIRDGSAMSFGALASSGTRMDRAA